MALSEDIDELRKLLDLRTGERDRIQQQLEETTTKLADPDGPAVGRLLATKQKLEATLDRLDVEIPAITGRIEILTDRLAAEETAAEIERLQAIAATAREQMKPFPDRFRQLLEQYQALLLEAYEVSKPGNEAMEKLYTLKGETPPGGPHDRPVCNFGPFGNWMSPAKMLVLEPFPQQYHWIGKGADFCFQKREIIAPWRKPAEPAAVEPEHADAELGEEPIAS